MHNEDDKACCCATPETVDHARRRLLAGAAGAATAGAVAMATGSATAATEEARALYADPEKPGLPQIDMEIAAGRTALVVTDPQIDFLSEDGVTWGVVGESVTEQGTVDNIERLFKAAKAASIPKGCRRSSTSFAIARSTRMPPKAIQLAAAFEPNSPWQT